MNSFNVFTASEETAFIKNAYNITESVIIRESEQEEEDNPNKSET